MTDLLIDCDGVVLDFSRGYVNFLKEVHDIHSVSGCVPSEFSFKDLYPHVEKPWAHIRDFSESFAHFSSIQAYDSAKKFLPQIKQSGAADRIIMLTSCGTSASTVSARRHSLEREFGNLIDDILFFELGASKLDSLRKFSPSIFVDDLKIHCEEASSVGHSARLYTQKYNERAFISPPISRINCLSELL